MELLRKFDELNKNKLNVKEKIEWNVEELMQNLGVLK